MGNFFLTQGSERYAAYFVTERVLVQCFQITVYRFIADLHEQVSTEEQMIQIKKNSDIFHISAHNIDCVYSLEPPRRGGSNEYP